MSRFLWFSVYICFVMCNQQQQDRTVSDICLGLFWSTVWVKKEAPPKTFCDIFTHREPVYFSWLLPNHITTQWAIKNVTFYFRL